MALIDDIMTLGLFLLLFAAVYSQLSASLVTAASSTTDGLSPIILSAIPASLVCFVFWGFWKKYGRKENNDTTREYRYP